MKSKIITFLAPVGLCLALLSVAATGDCPTAKLGQTNCASEVTPSCEFSVTWPEDQIGTQCTKRTATNNRKPGICGSPFDKKKKCLEQAGNVAVTYIAYKIIENTEGDCLDCNLNVVERTLATTVSCPTTEQDTVEHDDCLNES